MLHLTWTHGISARRANWWKHRFIFITPETKQDPMGLLGMEAFLCLPLSETGFSLHDLPELQGQVQTVANQGRERCKRQERSSQKHGAAFRQVWLPPRDTQSNIISLFCRTKTQQMEEEIHLIKCPSFQRGHSLVTLRTREAYLETT